MLGSNTRDLTVVSPDLHPLIGCWCKSAVATLCDGRKFAAESLMCGFCHIWLRDSETLLSFIKGLKSRKRPQHLCCTWRQVEVQIGFIIDFESLDFVERESLPEGFVHVDGNKDPLRMTGRFAA